MVSLKDLRDRLQRAEGYVTTAQANNFIATQASVSTTNNLGSLPLSHYNCNGGCGWSCSGSCSRGAGGNPNTPPPVAIVYYTCTFMSYNTSNGTIFIRFVPNNGGSEQNLILPYMANLRSGTVFYFINNVIAGSNIVIVR